MRVSLRTKIVAIVAISALAFIASGLTSLLVTRHVEEELKRIEGRLIPRLELRPQIENDFSQLRRSYHDAVTSGDPDALDRTREIHDRLVARLERSAALFDAGNVHPFLIAVAEYHEAAVDVSRRMIQGEGGEALVEQMALMQRKQARATELLEKLVRFDAGDLGQAFRTVHTELGAGARTRLAVNGAGLFFVLVLCGWLSRGMVRSLASLHAGLLAFGAGRFDRRIEIDSSDELADIATKANQMASELESFVAERQQIDWRNDGLLALAKEIRGELKLDEVATRASRMVARTLGAPAAAIYALESTSGLRTKLRLCGHFALTPGTGAGDAPETFDVGQGLVGEAARSQEMLVIDALPPNYLRVRSGVGEADARAIVLAPLHNGTEPVGVLEVALFTSLMDHERTLLREAGDIIAVKVASARSHAETQALLRRTQEQAARLLAQEEDLRRVNEELQAQQEELRQTNEELQAHAEQVTKHRADLEEKNQALEDAGQRLEQKASQLARVSSYKSEFLANMSHELRTPLNSMLLLSQLLADNADGKLTTKQAEYARTIHTAGKDLLLLINQVLDLAKVESGKQEIHVEAVRLDDMADRVRRVFTPLAREKQLELTVDVARDLPETIITDGQRLGQILTNLVANAIKFTSRGAVNVRIVRPAPSFQSRVDGLEHGRTVAFEVSDTGPGIPAEHQERVFAPFEQVDGSGRRRHAGTGLGLSISREFATLLGGELRLSSALGEGSTFVCYLPFETKGSPPREGTPLAASRSAPASTDSQASPASERKSDLHLLVIEDDPVFAEGLGHLIAERGLKHMIARDGKTGVRLAQERRPRGIILDVRLPDIDGWQVMEELRSDPSTQKIPVHFVSALEMKARGLAMGAAGYLTKPVARDDLVAVIESVAAGGTTLDRTEHRVLIVDDDELVGDALVEQLSSVGFPATRVSSTREALASVERERFACVIVDPSVHDMRDLDLLTSLDASGSRPAVVVYTSRPLSRAEVMRLETYAEAVVMREGASGDRIVDELRLFVRRLESGLPRRSLSPMPVATTIRLEGKKLLVVDDDMRTVYALSATLRAKGAEVLVADNGEEALKTLHAHPDIHAVLMDVMMPEMDGYEATRRIRAQPRFASLPIIAITAKAMKGDEARCIEAGATGYLPKPIDADTLLALLDVHVRIERAT